MKMKPISKPSLGPKGSVNATLVIVLVVVISSLAEIKSWPILTNRYSLSCVTSRIFCR